MSAPYHNATWEGEVFMRILKRQCQCLCCRGGMNQIDWRFSHRLDATNNIKHVFLFWLKSKLIFAERLWLYIGCNFILQNIRIDCSPLMTCLDIPLLKTLLDLIFLNSSKVIKLDRSSHSSGPIRMHCYLSGTVYEWVKRLFCVWERTELCAKIVVLIV